MFNFPTKGSKIPDSAYRQPSPISRTTVLRKDILKSVKERNQRVEIKDKVMKTCSNEKLEMTKQFKSDTVDIKNSHERAINELEADCTKAKKLLSENAKNYALDYKQSRIIKRLLNIIEIETIKNQNF